MKKPPRATTRFESLDSKLQAIDTLTGAHSVVIDEKNHVVCGRLPPAVEMDGVICPKTLTWQEIQGWSVLSIALHGTSKTSRYRILAFFASLDDTQRTNVETVYGMAQFAMSDSEQLITQHDAMRRMFQSVLDTIPVRVFWKNLDGVYLGANRLFAEDAGCSGPQELVGKTDFELAWAEQADAYRADDFQVMASGRGKIDYEEPQTTPEGDQVWLQTSKRPLRDGQENIFGVLGTYRDISARKDVEAERETLLVELEKKNAELERFTYTASHDLKSPLVTIKGFLGLLDRDLKDACPPNTHVHLNQHTQRIQRAADTMHQLLEDLLEMSRVGHALGPLKPVALRTLVDDALLLCSGVLAKSNAEIHLQGPFPEVHVDGQRIVQVIQNLLDNACKYRQPDKPLNIQIRAWEKGSLTVTDNGIGISERYFERIFGLFEKLDASSEGSGIGLALVKRIVESHGGSIDVESSGRGRGTTFRIALPLSPSHG